MTFDIGGLCNDRDLLCRSQNARCSQANIPPTCQCKLNHIPIYQENLKYHECFPIVHCNTTEYKACASSHGVCVDSNGDSQPDQCVCPPFLSKRRSNMQAGSEGQRIEGGEAISYDANWSSMNVILEKQVHFSKESSSISSNVECSTPLVRIACSTSTLLVCFYPPSSTPYQSLNQDLANGHAIAYFVGAGQSGQMLERTCVLTFSEMRSRGSLSYGLSAAALDGHTTLFTAMEKHLCTYIDFSKHSAKRLPCGTTVHRNKSEITFSGVLEIRTDAKRWNSPVDLSFPIICSSKSKTRLVLAEAPVQMSLLERVPRWNKNNLRPTPGALDMTFKLSTADKKSAHRVQHSTPISMQATLFDPTGTYKSLAVEDCYASVVNSRSDKRELTNVHIISRGCPVPGSGFSMPFLSITTFNNSISQSLEHTPPTASTVFRIEAAPFPAFTIDRRCKRAINRRRNLTGSRQQKTMQNALLDAVVNSKFYVGDQLSTFIKITCVFRICVHHAWCLMPRACNPPVGPNQPDVPVTFMPPNVHFEVRSEVVEVINTRATANRGSTAIGTQGCKNVFCQPQTQLLVIIIGLCTMLCLSMACGCLVSRNRQLLALKASRTTHGPSLPAVGICGSWRRKKLRRKVTSDPWNASTTLNQNNYLDSNILPSMQPQQLSYVEQSYIHFHSTPSYNEFLIDSSTHADVSARDSLILPNIAKVGVGVSPLSAQDAANEFTLQRITPSERQRSNENAIEPWDPQYLSSATLEPKSHLEANTAQSHKSEFYREPLNTSEVPPKPSILLPVSGAIGQNTRFLQERRVSGVGFRAGNSISVSPDGMHTFLNKSAVEASSHEMQLELSPRGSGELRGTNRQRNINGVTLGRDADGSYPQPTTPNVTNHHQIPSPNYQRITPHRKNTISPPSARTDIPSAEVVPHRGNSNNSDFYCRVRNVYVLPEFSYCISAPDDRLE